MTTTFNRLIKLYRKNQNSGKTPLEDYTTEILAGILESHDNILNDFVNEILQIRGNGFTVYTQRRYYLDGEIDCIVDMVIENEEMVCFIENKVNSKEGYKQLDRYFGVLKELKYKEGRAVHLRYCTKYYDKKDIRQENFQQFRWHNVYKFLEKYEEDTLVYEFLDFMRGENMASAGQFNLNDIMSFSNIGSTISKMNESFDGVRGFFEENFGKTKRTTTINQLMTTGGYWMWTNELFGYGYSEINIGYYLPRDENQKIPYITCVILCNKNNTSHKIFHEKVHDRQYCDFDKFETNETYTSAEFQMNMTDILTLDDQSERIQEWFVEKLKCMMRFREENQDLQWNN